MLIYFTKKDRLIPSAIEIYFNTSITSKTKFILIDLVI